jgi:alpha-methylacyl-CoA racemase
MAGREACFAPVLDIDEAWSHPHMVERGVFTRFDEVLHPSPAPRFSRTPGSLRRPAPAAGAHGPEVLVEWGLDAADLDALKASGALHLP